MSTRDVFDLIAEQAKANPQAVAVRTEHEVATYGDVLAEAAAVSGWLQQRGVGPEQIVALQMDRNPRLISCLLGILQAGAAYLPIDDRLPAGRRRFLLEDSSCAALVFDGERALGDLPNHCTPFRVDELIAGCPGSTQRVHPATLAYVIYTSGTTGQPKGVMVSRRSMSEFVGSAGLVLGVDAVRYPSVLSTTSLSFDVSVFEIFGPLAAGAEIVLLDSIFDVQGLPERMRPEVLSTVPSVLGGLAAIGDLPESLETVVAAGEVLNGATAQAILDHGLRLINAYGPTEATVLCSFDPNVDSDDVTIGNALASSSLVVLDDTLRPVDSGTVGRLFIRGPQLARGYLRRPGITAERFVPDPFGPPSATMYDTGDLAEIDGRGVVRFHGRGDDQVKIRGFRIELGEIEAVLAYHPAVENCVAMVVDSLAGPRLACAVTLNGPATTEELMVHARHELPSYMVPAAIVTVDMFPRSTSGKLDRVELARTIGRNPTPKGQQPPCASL